MKTLSANNLGQGELAVYVRKYWIDDFLNSVLSDHKNCKSEKDQTNDLFFSNASQPFWQQKLAHCFPKLSKTAKIKIQQQKETSWFTYEYSVS